MENPATWGKAEHVVQAVITECERERADGEFRAGLSMVRQITDALRREGLLDEEAEAAIVAQCPQGPHREPQGPNEDIAVCMVCWSPTFDMRPENEQIGLHADDCSLPIRHQGYCVGGGSGHPPVEHVRGYWPGMDEDILAARARFADQGGS